MPPPLTVTPATIGNAQIQAALAAGQLLCDPSGRGRHVIPSRSRTANAGKIVFQQGPGNGQNPPWSSTSFAGGTVTANGDILCVLASIIRMIGDPAFGASTVTPQTLATNFNSVTGTPPSNPYNTNRLLKGILNSYELVIRQISPRGDFFQYILDYTGYVILFGKGGDNKIPPFITNGHWVYIRSYDPATDLYYIGQSFGNQGALLDHTRGYKITDLIKATPAEGGVVSAYGVMPNSRRRNAARATPLSGPSTTAMSWEDSPSGPARTNITDFSFLGLGTLQEDGNYRAKTGEYAANYNAGYATTGFEVVGTTTNYYGKSFNLSDVAIYDATWGNGTISPEIRDAAGNLISGGNDAYVPRIGDQRRYRFMSLTREGYGIYRDNNLYGQNLMALSRNQPPPNANVLVIALTQADFDEGQYIVNPNAQSGYIPYVQDANGNTIVPAAPDQFTVITNSPEGYAVYINLTQVRRAGDDKGAPRFIRLDGLYVPYIIIPNPANTGPGSSVASTMTQIAPGNHTIYKFDKNSATLDKIANISIA